MIIPSFKTGYARFAHESENPTSWQKLRGAWMPTFGPNGDTLIDASPHKYHGVIQAKGKFTLTGNQKSPGHSLTYNASSDWVTLPSAVKLAGITCSMVAWFRTTSTSNVTIYGEGSTSSGTPFFILDITGFGQPVGSVRFTERSDSAVHTTLTSSNTDNNNGAWHHVAVILAAGGGTMTMYIDGVQRASTTSSTGTFAMNSYKIGTRQNGSTTHQSIMDGDIGPVKTWSRLLTVQECRKDYEDGLAQFRVRPRPIYLSVPAPVGGLSIPIAAYHYNHHLGSMSR